MLSCAATGNRRMCRLAIGTQLDKLPHRNVTAPSEGVNKSLAGESACPTRAAPASPAKWDRRFRLSTLGIGPNISHFLTAAAQGGRLRAGGPRGQGIG